MSLEADLVQVRALAWLAAVGRAKLPGVAKALLSLELVRDKGCDAAVRCEVPMCAGDVDRCFCGEGAKATVLIACAL